MAKQEKTNVMRLLDQKKIPYEIHDYSKTDAIAGEDVAAVLGENPDMVFKTLVTVGKSKQNYVFLVPVNRELNLKKAANAVGEKSIEMIKSKDLLGLTGYIHGGCSPIGMKKPLPTFIDDSCTLHERIYISAGVRGLQIAIAPNDLIGFVGATVADIV